MLLAALPICSLLAASDSKISVQELILAEKLVGVPQDVLRFNDVQLFGETYFQGGGDLFQKFIRFIFPISGREKRTIFMSLPFWGPKKPQYQVFDWKRFESGHFNFLAYPEGQSTLDWVVGYLEEEYEENNRIFGVDNRFTKKIPVIYYQSRQDFEQTHLVHGPVPEGLGGLTEIFAWRRVTFPFEGEKSKLEHVAKHEGTHIYQVAKGARKLPLWFIEGSAETNSIYWDADAELTIRDAYVNGFFFPIRDLWKIRGSWLMYKQGNFITNLIWDEYGEAGFRKIYDRARAKGFESNLKESLGITLDELEGKVSASLGKRYGALLKQEDILKRSQELEKGKVLFHAHGPFYLSGGLSGPRSAIYINYLGLDGRIIKKKIVSDRRFRNESLGFFRKGGSLNEKYIVYSIKRSDRDEIRLVPYRFDLEKRSFLLDKTRRFSWDHIYSIEDPVLVDETKLAFIGYVQGFSHIFLFDWEAGVLQKITKGRAHYSGLDYSPRRKEFIFSKEDVRSPNRIHYDRNLYTLHIETQKLTKITDTPTLREEQPRFSLDGKEVLYVADPDETYELMHYDFDKTQSRRLTKMRVGARKPQWGAQNSILFNGYKRLAPFIYRVTRPSENQTLLAQKPTGTYTEFAIQNSKFVAVEPQTKKSKLEPPQEDGFHFYHKKPIVRFQDDLFIVRAFANLGGELVMEADPGLASERKIKPHLDKQYFVLHEGRIEPLISKMVARRRLQRFDRTKIQKMLKGRDVIDAWISQDSYRILVLVNNRLANDSDRYKDEPEVSLFLYDSRDASVRRLASGPIKDLSNQIQWVSFLSQDSVFIAIGDSRRGPFHIYVYRFQKGKYELLSHDAEQFRITQDFQTILWTSRGSFYVRSLSTDKTKRLSQLEHNSGDVLAFDSIGLNRALVFSLHGKQAKLYELLFEKDTQIQVKNLSYPKDVKLISASVNNQTGDLVALARPLKRPHVPEKIFHWKYGETSPEILFVQGPKHSKLAFRQGYLTFHRTGPVSTDQEKWVWYQGKQAKFDEVMEGDETKLGKIIHGKKTLLFSSPKKNRFLPIAWDPAGYTLHQKEIIYSAQVDDHFQLFSFSPQTRKHRQVTQEKRNAVKPKIDGKKLRWESFDGENWSIGEASVSNIRSQKNLSLLGYDVTNLQIEDGLSKVQAFEKKKPHVGKISPAEDTEIFPHSLLRKRAPGALKLQTLTAAAAFDGSDFRFLFSGFADNLFSDRGLFVDSIFLGDARFATVGYVDLRYGNSYSFFFNSRDEIDNFGVEYAHSFALDRYREINWYTDFEIQDYGLATLDTANFVTPTIENRKFYVLKTGVVYAYDVSVRDFHGPSSGSRFFFRTEAGLDAGNLELSNLDANLDFRLYHRILPRFGFAHRFVAGTSQGDLPTVFLLGGNMSFRGVSFDDLNGQNYWVFSEDLRLPVFDFIGAKFFDPIDSIFGFLTRYIDVRSGIYADVGSVWFNDEDIDVKHSVGYFINVPTVFGVIFRFNQGFLGEKDIGIWLGANW